MPEGQFVHFPYVVRGFFLLLLILSTAPAEAQPAAPNEVRTWGLTLSRTMLTWKDNAGDESEYRVERSTDGGAWTEVSVRPANSTEYEDSSVDSAKTYRYRVRAYRSSDTSFSGYSQIVAGPEKLSGTNFRVFYNTTDCPPYAGGQVNCVPNTTTGGGNNEYASRMLNISEGCREEYANFGFLPGWNPVAPDKFPFNLKWCDGGGCAGGWGFGLAPQYLGTYDPNTNTGDPGSLLVPIHELFHMVQFSYDSLRTDPDGNWAIEGQARAIQDLACVNAGGIICQNVDDEPNGVANYLGEVNGYLGNPNRPVNRISYGAALFWIYMCDQYGNLRTEPELGMDFLEEFWDEADDNPDRDGIQVIDQTLANLGESDRFVDAFKNFVIANYAKGLNGPHVPSKYRYTDESQLPGPYNNVRLDVSEDLTPLEQVGPTLSDVTSWGARYHEYRPAAGVPYLQLDYKVDSSVSAYFVLLAIKGNDIVHEEKHTGLTFARTLANDAYDKVVVIIAGLDNLVNFRYTVNGVNPVLRILDPLTGRKAKVGDKNAPEKFLTKIEVLSPTAQPITGIAPNAFTFKVGNQTLSNSDIITSAYIQGQYWFVLQAPTQPSNSDYNFSAKWSILSATENLSIRYQPRADADNVLVIDRSGSMGAPASKMGDAKDGANLYVDSWRNGDKVGVVSFDCSAALDLSLRNWNPTSRDDAHDAINLLTAGGGTAIGTGLKKGLDQLVSNGDAAHSWALILLSDGMNVCGETIQQFLDAYKARKDIGDQVPQVHTIAIGSDANRPDLQRLSSETGGTYHFASEPSSPKALGIDEFFLNMADIHRVISTEVAGFDEVLSARDVTQRVTPDVHKFFVEKGVSELVAAIRWRQGNPTVKLIDPLGNDFSVPFLEVPGVHRVYRIPAPEAGEWKFIVELGCAFENKCESYYMVEAAVSSTLSMDLYLGLPIEDRVVTMPMPIYVSLTDTGPIKGAFVLAAVTNPSGAQSSLRLWDDGAHGDGQADDGIYANTFYSTGMEGTYQVDARAEGDSDMLGHFTRRKLESFNMSGDNDSDKDRMPDNYEKRVGLDPKRNDAGEDPDGDKLINYLECVHGTNPFDPDTDDGGESDGSEVLAQNPRNPHEPGDDRVKPPQIRVLPGVNSIIVRFNIPEGGRQSPPPKSFKIYRKRNPRDPFELIEENFPVKPPYQYETRGLKKFDWAQFMVVSVGNGGEESAPSDPEESTVREDPYPPHGSILINGGAMTADNLDAKLTLMANDLFDPDYALDPRDAFDPAAKSSGVADMLVSNKSDGSDSQWEPYQKSKQWILEPNDLGFATVFVIYRDHDGNESSQYHATITIVEAVEPTSTPTPTSTKPLVTPTQTLTPQGGATKTMTPTPTSTCAIGVLDYDVVPDGEINAFDLLEMLRSVRNGQPVHDLNCDGKMDWADFVEFSTMWKSNIR